MKSLYKRFNELKSEEEIEPMDVSNEEKEAMKQQVRMKIQRRRRVPRVWRNVAAAAIITVASVTAVGIAFPTLASQIPIVSNIFSIFNEDQDGFYTDYEEYAVDIAESQTSKGITIMVDRAVYDGKTVTLTYSVETAKELGQNAGVNSPMDIKHTNGSSGTSTALKKVADNKYVGMITTTPDFDKKPDFVDVSWVPDSIVNYDTMKETAGDWEFHFKLKPMTGDVQLVDQSAAKRGVEITIEEIRFTEISTIIEYSQKVDSAVTDEWEWVTADLAVKDNLGSEYLSNGNGGFSENGQDYHFSTTLKKIDKEATSLIFTPEIYMYNGSGNKNETVMLEPIEIELVKK
ncbi:DUF4179 domain-containing protein [Sporosarcina cascadiensis]|uniref:DUF4179 domain-containing protein n=1 Tax=Sporosarcina cascadiensis TaxID=2660747 RepID=UPI0018910BB8|nr:DUF4179 domain-containing protein [Sporosarcina cascadiensis]